MTSNSHRIPDGWKRVLVLHAYPPESRLHTFERGLRALGHDVVSAGPASTRGSVEAWRDVDPDTTYVATEPDASLDDIFEATGGVPDWVFYLRPSTAFLPSGLRSCPVPTVAWFEDEFRYIDVFLRLGYYFDLVGTAYEDARRVFTERGMDNCRCFNYVTASWLFPERAVDFHNRPTDVSFVGNSDPRSARLRGLKLEQLSRLAVDGIHVEVRDGIYLRDMMRVYARSKIVFQRSGQGPPHLTYRVGEAMAAGAMVLAKHPVHADGLPQPLVEGKHLVYFSDFDEVSELIRYYLDNEDERLEIAQAGHRYVREESPWLDQVASFLQQHVYTLPAGHQERREERLAELGIDSRREQLDRALYFAVCGGRPDLAKNEIEVVPSWEDDVTARSYRAATASDAAPEHNYIQDMRFVLDQDACHLLTVSNYATAVWKMRGIMPAAHIQGVVEQALKAFAETPGRDVQPGALDGIMVLRDARYRLEVTNAYLHLSGGSLRARLHAVLLSQLHRNHAELLEDAGDYPGALAALQEAVRHVRDDGYAFAQLARVADKTGRVRDAIRFLRHALQIEPYFGDAYCELGSLLLHSRRPDEAAELLEQARLSHQRADASRLGIILGLAASRLRLHQKDRAKVALQQGIDEIDFGYIDMGDWRIYRHDDAVPMERLIRTREAMRVMLEQVTEGDDTVDDMFGDEDEAMWV
jgi:tetratricopeptide (TPR) repeat protein